MTDVSISTRGLTEAVARLRVADAIMQREFQAALTQAAEPFIENARKNALERLPRRGGLGAVVAESDFQVIALHGQGVAGVRIATDTHDKRIDQGILRHPVWGHWRSIANQSVTPGWFSDAGPKAKPAVRRALLVAASTVARKVAP